MDSGFFKLRSRSKQTIKAIKAFLKKKIGTKVDPTGKQMYLIFPTILFVDAYLVQAVNPNIARTQKLDRLLVVAFESKKR